MTEGKAEKRRKSRELSMKKEERAEAEWGESRSIPEWTEEWDELVLRCTVDI